MAEAEPIEINRERFDHFNEERLTYRGTPGLTEEVIHHMSDQKKEPEWMRNFRLKAFKIYGQMPMPSWGPSLDKLNLDDIYYFMRPDALKNANSWDQVPDDIKKTF